MEDQSRQFQISIENRQSLSWLELKEIIGIIDDYVLDYAYREFFDEFPFPPLLRYRGPQYRDFYSIPDNVSFVEIERVEQGSIILVVVGGIATFTLTAIAAGVRRSSLPGELSRFGTNVGNILGDGVGAINQRLEDWSETNKALRDRDTSVRFEELPPPGTDDD